MISLTYMSTASSPFDDDSLRALLDESRRNNHANGLTGMLLHAGGHFIQTLEGPEPQVYETYTRICADNRHRNVIEALRDTIAERTFGDWSMGFETLDEDQARQMPGFNDFLAAQTELQRTASDLGRAGIFHRIFRDRMR